MIHNTKFAKERVQEYLGTLHFLLHIYIPLIPKTVINFPEEAILLSIRFAENIQAWTVAQTEKTI